MTGSSNRQDGLRYTRPFAAANDVPASPQANVTPTRFSHSYSDMTYEWAVFRTTGRTLEEYTPLRTAAKRMKDGRTRAKSEPVNPPPGDDTVEDTDEEELGQEVAQEDSRVHSIERLWLYLAYSLGFNESGAHLTRPILATLYNDYFYRNVWLHSLAWFYFYFQEYLYVWLALHFPFLDFLTLYPIYDWPAHIDMYFGRLAFAAFFSVYFTCFFFQYRFGAASRFDWYVACAQFIGFFGSAFLYYRSGFAPFILMVGLTVLIAVPYTFFYFVPRRLSDFQLRPPLLLPAPTPQLVLCLPRPRYFYQFFPKPVAVPCRRRFTAYPFTTNVQKLAASQRFIRRVLLHDYFSAVSRPGAWAGPGLRAPPVGGMPFELSYGFNPYDTYEEFFLNRLFTVNDFSDDLNRTLGGLSYQSLRYRLMQFTDEDIEHSDAFVFELPERFYSEDKFPSWMHNTTFFARSIRQATRSIYRNHFTSDVSTSFLVPGPRPALWQTALMNDPYFGLQLWLRQMAPVVRPVIPRTSAESLFTIVPPTVSEPKIYPYFGRVLGFAYGCAVWFFDGLTLGRYRTFVPTWHKPQLLLKRAAWLSRFSSRFFFRPTSVLVRAFLRFLLQLEARLDNDAAFRRFISREHGFRHVLLHHLGIFWLNLSESSLRSRVRRSHILSLGLRSTLRVLPRVLFKLTRLYK